MLKSLKIGNLIAQIPIVQGGMGVGISLSKLAGAVAAEGGVGVISAAQPGFNWDGFQNNPLKANLEALAHHIKQAKERAKGGIIGVNIMCAINHYADYVKCAVENKADLIISGAGLPTNLPALVKDSAVKIAPIVSSVKATSILLKLWDKKFDKKPDMIVVEGPKAGGHLGFTKTEAEELGCADYKEEVKGILREVAMHTEDAPTIFAGGIYNRVDIDEYMALGCAGVQMASRFVATEECDASENFKQAYISAKTEDITIVKSPVGMPGRALNNDFIKGLSSAKEKIEQCSRCIRGCDPKTIPYCITQALINAALGKTNEGLIFCGSLVDRIKEITTVKKIFGELQYAPT